MAPAQNFFALSFHLRHFWLADAADRGQDLAPILIFGNLTVFDRLYLRAQWDFFNNFLCFEKLRPSSRRYAGLRGLFAYSRTPPRGIPIIANRKIHFPTPNIRPNLRQINDGN